MQARARFREHGAGVVVEVKDAGLRCRVVHEDGEVRPTRFL